MNINIPNTNGIYHIFVEDGEQERVITFAEAAEIVRQYDSSYADSSIFSQIRSFNVVKSGKKKYIILDEQWENWLESRKLGRKHTKRKDFLKHKNLESMLNEMPNTEENSEPEVTELPF